MIVEENINKLANRNKKRFLTKLNIFFFKGFRHEAIILATLAQITASSLQKLIQSTVATPPRWRLMLLICSGAHKRLHRPSSDRLTSLYRVHSFAVLPLQKVLHFAHQLSSDQITIGWTPSGAGTELGLDRGLWYRWKVFTIPKKTDSDPIGEAMGKVWSFKPSTTFLLLEGGWWNLFTIELHAGGMKWTGEATGCPLEYPSRFRLQRARRATIYQLGRWRCTEAVVGGFKRLRLI